MTPLFWSILLMALGLLLVLAEVFIPSGGIMGFLALSSVATSIVLAFWHEGLDVGLIFLTLASLGLPTAVVLAFRFWPRTPLGKRLLLELPTSESVLPDTPARRRLRELVGKVGTAKTVMLPSGAVLVEGMTVDAISEGMPIEAGQSVVIIAVQGGHAVVRPADEGDTIANRSRDDLLSQPIDTLGLRPIDDPLA